MTFDLPALIAIGTAASLFFWRMLIRVEKKVEAILHNMVTREDFNGHFHTPDGAVAVKRGCQWGCEVHETAEGVSRDTPEQKS